MGACIKRAINRNNMVHGCLILFSVKDLEAAGLYVLKKKEEDLFCGITRQKCGKRSKRDKRKQSPVSDGTFRDPHDMLTVISSRIALGLVVKVLGSGIDGRGFDPQTGHGSLLKLRQFIFSNLAK